MQIQLHVLGDVAAFVIQSQFIVLLQMLKVHVHW